MKLANNGMQRTALRAAADPAGFVASYPEWNEVQP